ncbi:MAG: peptidoglycan editing factor PgeF [Candidatus Poribacteria bacterium]|nr:peptidoglycan editing factor PgeF [Candidatus Poribacteria bacterium]
MYHTINELADMGFVNAGISLRCGGVSKAPYASLNLAFHVEDNPAAVSQNQHIFSTETGIKALKYCHQIHSDTVINADAVAASSWNVKNQNAPKKTGDALISAQRGDTLGIFTADCVPIFILDIPTPAIGIAHAGWRGTLARIAAKTLVQMKNNFGTLAENCLIYLGPSIQKCCYTVSSNLISQFVEHFGDTVHNGLNLSLQTAIFCQLVDIGVNSESILISPFCTACHTDKFYSYRAEGGQTGRMLSFIQLIN